MRWLRFKEGGEMVLERGNNAPYICFGTRAGEMLYSALNRFQSRTVSPLNGTARVLSITFKASELLPNNSITIYFVVCGS